MSNAIPDLLTPTALKALRAAYSRAIMNQVATTVVASPYAPSKAFVGFAGDRYYQGEPSATVTSPADRERVLIGIFASGRRPSFALAVHIYWGLMEGLSVDAVADTLLLAGTYGGLDVMSDSFFTCSETLRLLQRFADEGGAATNSGVLLQKLVAAFRATPSQIA